MVRCIVSIKERERTLYTLEASLANTETAQAKLVDSQKEVLNEVEKLRAQLVENQDPNKMQVIQEMIGVC